MNKPTRWWHYFIYTLLGLLYSNLGMVAEVDHSNHLGHGTSQSNIPNVDHSAHQSMDHSAHKEQTSSYSLPTLATIPSSGKAREAGFDNRYGMEPTSIDSELAIRCAHGSRGIVMLDNAIWQQCGGKPQGASLGPGYYPAVPPWNQEGTGKVMDHSMMNH